MFDIASPFSTFVPDFFLFGHSVIIAVSIFKNIIGIGLRNQD